MFRGSITIMDELNEINYEINRVHRLLQTSKNIHTKKQNHKYLKKLIWKRNGLLQKNTNHYVTWLSNQSIKRHP